MDKTNDYADIHRTDLRSRPELVHKLLEEDQLCEFKRQTKFGRRKLSGKLLFLLWAMRIYVVFMLALVILEILHAFH